jgi:transposase
VGYVIVAHMMSTEAKWLDRVLEWRASGLSADQFAQGKDYEARTLVWYLPISAVEVLSVSSPKLGFQRPGPVRVVTARAKYKIEATETESVRVITKPLPKTLLSRCVVAPSLLAHIIASKFRFGMPYVRQEQALAADGIELARSTMARCIEDVGASLGAVVLTMVDDARRTAFCLSTDATGISIRPEPLADGSRQPCRKGLFFVVLADKKHTNRKTRVLRSARCFEDSPATSKRMQTLYTKRCFVEKPLTTQTKRQLKCARMECESGRGLVRLHQPFTSPRPQCRTHQARLSVVVSVLLLVVEPKATRE